MESLKLEWHFIGPLQSNKTKQVAENFNWVHTVDRLKIAKRLNDQRPEHLGPLNICLQINIDNEPTKSGVIPNQGCELALSVHQLPNLRLRGLMAIPNRSGLDSSANLLKHCAYCKKKLIDNWTILKN